MQNSGYQKGYSPLLSWQPPHGNLPLISFAVQASCPAHPPSRIWQRLQSCSYKRLFSFLKEVRKKQYKCRQALEQFCDIKTRRIFYNEHWMQSWQYYGLNRNPSTYEETGSAVLFKSPARFRSRSFDDALSLWSKWCENVQTCGQSTLVATFLSFLMCFLPLCLTGAPACAQEVLQKEASSAAFVTDISGMEGEGMVAEAATGAGGLAHANTFVSRAMPLFTLSENASVCEEAYGVFPCSNSLPGNLFLMLVYGYLLLTAAKLISEGSELLLEVMNPGLIGGLLLPILGALPDAALICASGVGGTVEEVFMQSLTLTQ